MEQWTAKDIEEIAAATLSSNPLPASSVKTKPATTKTGNQPGVVLVKCGWCGHEVLGTIETEEKTPYWYDTRNCVQTGERNGGRTWKLHDDHIWRISENEKDLYGVRKQRREMIERLIRPCDRKRDTSWKPREPHERDEKHHEGRVSWRGPRWELTYNNDRMDNRPRGRLPVLAMQCSHCHGITLVDLKPFAVLQ